MAKNPAFPFYAQDFLVDTMRWSRAMKGLHIDLLCESWINGGLENDKGFPVGLDADDKILWKKIRSKWTLLEGVWMNGKLEEIRAARLKFIGKQSEKGKKSAESRKNPVEPQSVFGSTVVEPLEREREKEDSFGIKEGVQGKPLQRELSDRQEIFELIFTDQKLIEELAMTHPDKDFQKAFNDCYLYFSNKPNPPNTLWAWREKLIGWIIRMTPEPKHGKSSTTNKHQQHTAGLADSYLKTYGSVLTGGPDGSGSGTDAKQN
jgi:hypothetical protein